MNTGADDDRRVMTILSAALKLTAAERQSYLRLACQGDEELFGEVGEALDWEERMEGFLQEPLIAFQAFDRPFQPGETISGRFEIIREVGEGGMGVVYEAFDRVRNQRIAIKSAKDGFRRWLPSELKSALKVRHPNDCLVNEIHTTATDHGGVDFLSMEFLDGQTLAARLSSGGKLEQKEGREVARQLCAGLAEAHRSGVIHRDLKCANIILSHAEDGSLRTVITDFGLAVDTVLDPGDLAGTPGYMAPELWRGDKPSKASDIYALGVILYEMVAGEKPFEDGPPESRFTSRFTARPAPPSSRTGKVDRRWDRAILRCLDPSPGTRPRDANQVLALLEKRQIRKTPWLAAALLFVVALIPPVRGRLMNYFNPPNVRLAILPVQGGADVAAIGNGALIDVADRLTHRSGAAPTLVVVPASESVNHNVHNPEQAKRVFNATHVLQMAIQREGKDLVVHGEIIALSTQTRLEELSGRYPLENASDIRVALAGTVSKALHLSGFSADQPISAAAAPIYFEGLYYVQSGQGSVDMAIQRFQDAARLDPHSPLAFAGLVEALILKYRVDRMPQWIDQAEQAFRSAEALNPDLVAVLLAGGRLEGSKGHYEKALQYYRRVEELEPRNVDIRLRFAAIDDRLDLRQEAIESYRKAIELEPGFYKTYQQFGVFYYRRGEYLLAAEQLRKAIENGPGLYEAYNDLGAALSDMGQDEEAAKTLLASLKIKETSQALNSLGAIRAYQRRDDEALAFYRRSLELNPRSYVCLMNMGDSARRLGNPIEARDFYSRGKDIAVAALDENPQSGDIRAYVGYFFARLGDQQQGDHEIRQALQLWPADKVVLRRAVLTYEMLGQRDRALEVASRAPETVLRELDRHPDLADFRQDPRFKELMAKSTQGGQ